MNKPKSISEAERVRRAKLRLLPLKHGATKDGARPPEYTCWLSMRARCRNPKHPSYKDYGGRGISVCSRWDSFPAFLADMGLRPANGEIERRDNNQGYCPTNCYWATRSAQMKNTRRTLKVSLNGKTQCLKDWCSELGLLYGTIMSRVKRGWSADKAIAVPIQIQYRHKNQL